MAKKPREPFPFKIVDTAKLSESDWAEIRKLEQAWEIGGSKGLSTALDRLAQDQVIYLRIMVVYFPELIREAIRDEMAARGMTDEDVRDLINKLQKQETRH